MEKLSDRKIFLILFISAFLIRLLFVLVLENRFYFPDEDEYYRMIVNFLEGRGLIAGGNIKGFRPPLYPLLASFVYYAGLGIRAVRILQALVSALTVPFIYLTSKKVFSKKVGLLSGAVSVFYPFFVFYNGFLLTETLFIFVLTLSVYALVSMGPASVSAIRAGIFLGLAGLTRPSIQIYVPFVALLILAFRESLRSRCKKIFLLVLFFAVTLSPWVVRNYIVFNKFVPGTTMGGYVFWEGNNPMSDGGPCHYFPENVLQMDEIERDGFLYRKTFGVIRQDPGRFRWLLWNKFKRFWNIVPNFQGYNIPLFRNLSIFSFGIMMPFFVLGFFLSYKNRRARFMHVIIILFTISHMVYLASIRYRVPIEPFYIIFAAYGLLWIWESSKQTLKRTPGGRGAGP